MDFATWATGLFVGSPGKESSWAGFLPKGFDLRTVTDAFMTLL